MSEGKGFENETRERLAIVETHQENLEEKVDGLGDGQDEILSRLDSLGDDFVTEDQLESQVENELEDVAETASENELARERRVAVYKFVAFALTLIAGSWGLLLYVV